MSTSMFFPFIHSQTSSYRQQNPQPSVKKIASKPDIISAGRKRQSILQIDSFRRLRSRNILASPVYSSVGRHAQSRKLILRGRLWIYDTEASATEQGPFPSGLGATGVLGDLWRGWHSWLLSVTEENWTWTGFREVECVCLCLWYGRWKHSNPLLFDFFFGKTCLTSTGQSFPRTNRKKNQATWRGGRFKKLLNEGISK